jgi:serine/threonine protein kinase
MKQHGGVILGEGTYGCVLKPSVRCKKFNVNNPGVPGKEIGNQPDDVAKIMKRGEAVKELKEMEKIAEIDPQNVFTLPKADLCRVDYSSQDEDVQKDIRNCRAVNHMGAIPIASLIMKDAGVSLSSISRNIRQYYNERNDNDKFNKFLSGLWRVFYGLYTINKNGYIHNDIKGDNIMVKEMEGEMRFNIIDFGLMAKKGEAEYLDYTILPATTRFLLPKKVRVLKRSVYEKSYRDRTIKNMTDEYINSGKLVYAGNILKNLLYLDDNALHQKIEEGITKYISEIKTYITQNYEKTAQDLSKYLNEKWSDTIDMYSFGLVLAQIINTISERDFDPKFGYLLELAHDMTIVNDFDRIKPKDALNKYTQLLVNNNIQLPKIPKEVADSLIRDGINVPVDDKTADNAATDGEAAAGAGRGGRRTRRTKRHGRRRQRGGRNNKSRKSGGKGTSRRRKRRGRKTRRQ